MLRPFPLKDSLLLILVLGMLACKPSGDVVKTEQCPDSVSCKIINMTGMDGCKWVIILADGTKLEPVNLIDYLENPEDGVKVKIAYRPVKTMSACMVGETVAITCLEK